MKTDDGKSTGKIAFYCKMLHVSRQAFYKYLQAQQRPPGNIRVLQKLYWTFYQNDTYGRKQMYRELCLKQPEGVYIPSERTVYRVMEELGIVHMPKRKPNGFAAYSYFVAISGGAY